MPDPIGTDRAGAIRYLGCTESRFVELSGRRRRKEQPMKAKTIIIDGVSYCPCEPESLSGYSIIRAKSGVYFGKIKEIVGSEATIEECRQLWYWKTKGLNCLEIAVHGILPDSRISSTFSCVKVLDVVAYLECNDVAAKSIKEYPAWTE